MLWSVLWLCGQPSLLLGWQAGAWVGPTWLLRDTELLIPQDSVKGILSLWLGQPQTSNPQVPRTGQVA